MPPTPTTRFPPESELLAQLHGIYAEADALLAGWTCPMTAECCHFGKTGKEPFVTSIELAEIDRGIAALGKRGGKPERRAKENEREQSRVCPMLTADMKCSVYDSRPLGCRTFFCNLASKSTKVPHEKWRDIVRRVEDIARVHKKEGHIGRPLGRVLGAPR